MHEGMTFKEVEAACREQIGEKVRLTFKFGQTTGVIRQKTIGVHDCLTIDHKLFGGENEGALKVEVKAGQRYQTVEEWHRPTATPGVTMFTFSSGDLA